MITINENDSFQSSDISLIAALLCQGAKIDSVERNNGPRAVFFIRREKGLDDLVQAFLTHTMQVDPLVYFNALKEAKGRLYSPAIY